MAKLPASKLGDLLLAIPSPTVEQVRAIMAHPLEAEAVHLSLLTLRSSTNKTVDMVADPYRQQIAELRGRASSWIDAYNEYAEDKNG